MKATVTERETALDDLRAPARRPARPARRLQTTLATSRHAQARPDLGAFKAARRRQRRPPRGGAHRRRRPRRALRGEGRRPRSGPRRPRPGRPSSSCQFDFASAALTPGGQAPTPPPPPLTLADMDSGAVRVIGHTDRVGSPAANRRLAAKRARIVADALIAAGLPRRADRDRRHRRGRRRRSPPTTASPSR